MQESEDRLPKYESKVRMQEGKELAQALGMSPSLVIDESIHDHKHKNQPTGVIYIKHTGLTEEQTKSLVKDFLNPILDELEIHQINGQVKAVNFYAGKESWIRTSEVPPRELQADSLEISIHHAESFKKVLDYLREHKKETAQAIDDIKHGRKPELPVQSLSENTVTQDHANFIKNLPAEKREIFDKQFTYNAALDAERKLAEQQAQENGIG